MADISKVSIPNVQNPYDIKDAKSQAALVPVINKGSKNIAVPYIPASISGITITANADGSFKFECSSVSENKTFRVGDIGNQPSGTFTISGVTGGSSSTYMLGLYNASASAVVYQHSSSSSSYTGDVSGFSLRVRIIAGYTGTFTVYPMITTSAEYAISPGFEQYAPTNRELYEDKAATEDVYGTTTTIAPASGETYNLNDLPIGRFQVPGSTYAQRITNSPTTDSGYDIECKYNGSSSYKYQIARPNRAGSAVFDIYIRHFGTTWSDWETVLTNTKVDSIPTQSSQNPVSSGGIWTDQQRQEVEIGAVANRGAKNLLWNHEVGHSETLHGRTFTVLSDGGIKITGTSSDSTNADFYIIGSWSNRDVVLNESNEQLTMRLSCTGDYGYNEIRFRLMDRSTGSTVSESGIEANKDRTFSHIVTTVFISIWPTVTLPTNGIIVYPMIRPASITDSTFQPYALPNPTLTPAAIKAVDEGAKNRLFFNEIGISASNHGTSLTTNAITYTVNSDGTISVSGTASAGAWVYLYNSADLVNAIDLFDGNHIITLNRGSTNISLFYSIDGASSVLLSDGDTLPASNGSAARIGMQVNKNVAISGTATVCPMICTAADWAVSQKFVPYCPSLPDLYSSYINDIILALLGRGTEIPNNSDLDNYTTPGNYYVLNNTNAETISNKPIGGSGFKLIVRTLNAANRPRQEFYKPNTPETFYVRSITTDNTWSAWYQFTGTAVT